MKPFLSPQRLLLVAAFFLSTAGLCPAQSDAPYTEGTVYAITMVRTKPGMEDEYLKSLAANLKPMLDEAKSTGLIISWSVLLGEAATPQDYNVVLVEQYKNMAAFDGLRDKFDPIEKKVVGDASKMTQLAVKRMEIRDIVGSKIMREIKLK
jgi:quinol monooxygenase YgiN